jgi:5-methyltetrahydrofolate--homocysteine methyltransferase
MQSLMEKLTGGGVVVGDGGWGSMILQRGLQRGHAPESINLSDPAILSEIAGLYLDAGAEIITTNTFGGTLLKLQPYGLDAQADEVNRQGVEVIRSAVGNQALVSASVGPTGKLIQPKGKTTADEVYLNFERQIRALLASGPDLLCIETMTDLEEAQLAIKAARDLSNDIPIMATMSFNQNRRGFFTIMGDSIAAVAAGLEAAGANIIGSNCGNGIEKMLEIAAEFKQNTTLPLVIQANAGLPSMQNGQTVYSETPEFMAEKAKQLLDLGVQVIGGCCGTTPEHIRALRKVVDSYPSAAI